MVSKASFLMQTFSIKYLDFKNFKLSGGHVEAQICLAYSVCVRACVCIQKHKQQTLQTALCFGMCVLFSHSSNGLPQS